MHRIAVFARNHAKHLESACAISAKDPSRLITFRSARRWVGAKRALDKQETLKLYLTPTGSKGTVEYQATLKALVLEPKKGDAETETWLAQTLPETVSEGLWEGDAEGRSVKTLYVISHCRRLFKFPVTNLRKAEDGNPMSEDFGYSYALVWELDQEPSVEVHPEEIAEPAQYFEGALRRITVNAYERNSAAREACVEHYGTNCAVCAFDFGATYGELGSGFIHVHHLTPLGSIKDGYQVDPINDLRPVCPNCHAMLHRRVPPFSIEELAALVNAKG